MSTNPTDYTRDEFLQGYLAAALWTGTDESDEIGRAHV